MSSNPHQPSSLRRAVGFLNPLAEEDEGLPFPAFTSVDTPSEEAGYNKGRSLSSADANSFDSSDSLQDKETEGDPAAPVPAIDTASKDSSQGKRQREAFEQQGKSPQQRSKQKQMMLDVEKTLSSLTQKVQDMQNLQGQNGYLADRCAKLEALLKEKEDECLQLKQKTPPAVSTTPAAKGSVSEGELKHAYCSSVESLKEFILVSNLRQYDICQELPDSITESLKGFIHNISKVCLQVMKPETPYVLESIAKERETPSLADWEADRSHWSHVISSIKLSDSQVYGILRTRDVQLSKLLRVYEERSLLARQAAECVYVPPSLLPRSSVEELNQAGIGRTGYLYTARKSLLLYKHLEALKESLHKEQKIVMESTLKLLYHILTPAQAAIYIVEAFPLHCDFLAMSNVLSTLMGAQSTPRGDSVGTPASWLSNSDSEIYNWMDSGHNVADVTSFAKPDLLEPKHPLLANTSLGSGLGVSKSHSPGLSHNLASAFSNPFSASGLANSSAFSGMLPSVGSGPGGAPRGNMNSPNMQGYNSFGPSVLNRDVSGGQNSNSPRGLNVNLSTSGKNLGSSSSHNQNNLLLQQNSSGGVGNLLNLNNSGSVGLSNFSLGSNAQGTTPGTPRGVSGLGPVGPLTQGLGVERILLPPALPPNINLGSNNVPAPNLMNIPGPADYSKQ